MKDNYSILFVCYGNICRSPSAEAVFKHKLAASPLARRVYADSAGTADFHIGKAPDDRAIATGVNRGYTAIEDLRARQLSKEDKEQFDLILIMDEKNKSAVSTLFDHDLSKVQFLFNFIDDYSLNAIADPFHGTLADFEPMFDTLEQAVEGLISALEKDLL